MVTSTELYRFSEQYSNLVWTFTSGNEVVSYLDEDYEPVSISRNDVTVKNELAKMNLEVTISLDNPLAVRWLKDHGQKIASLTIFERDKNGTFNVVWKGRLASIMPGMTSATLKMESIFTSLRRPGLRARYQKSCRHALYGRGCNLDAENFDTVGTVTAFEGETFTITEAGLQPDGYYVGGMLRAPDGTLSYVVNHSGELITVQRLSFSLIEAIEGGLPFNVTLYPGCDHSRVTCKDKFNNLLNYGGFDFIPTRNPLDGSSIV